MASKKKSDAREFIEFVGCMVLAAAGLGVAVTVALTAIMLAPMFADMIGGLFGYSFIN